ncbi:hypothetical protein [Devosia yakushimensis]|uniref:hypothetical protein n=1 Tax=Devosia yakushimensis TaxID=470028 RepID=UPI0024E0B512|nr:hypothetical protein [Devosia yakushimensis]
MANASEQFRQSDVTLWGLVALIVGGIAVFSANVSAIVPPSLLAGLHKTRLEGASVEQLRLDVSELRKETLRLKNENTTLLTRFALQEQSGGEVTRRVGALEVSLPRLLEAVPDSAEIDRSILTSSIGNGEAVVFAAEGGSVKVSQQPMPQALPSAPDNQPLPDPVETASIDETPAALAFGVAVGPEIAAADAGLAWNDISTKVGPLLLGLAPRLADQLEGDGKRIVVGPIAEISQARALCNRLESVSISCTPMPFTGIPLPN